MRVVYYRKRDLDVEHVGLRFNAAYSVAPTYSVKIEYNIQNFDDFLVDDAYYTANIVEVNLIKDLSF
jgi:hypothetical protein